MRKMLSAALLMCIVTLLFTLSTPVHATKPITAEGTWTYKPTIIGGGDWGFYGDEIATWTGTFVGTSYDVFTVVFNPSGLWRVIGLIFFEGTVNGAGGSLVISFIGKKPAEEDWYGQWMILSGTDDLADLRGQGTWSGPGAPAPGQEGPLDYSGRIRFD